MSEKYRGKVGVAKNGNVLRLRLPRGLFNNKQQYIALGLPDTPANRKIAKAKAQQIESDILFNNFDYSLKRYKVLKNKEVKPTLADILLRFTEFKQDIIRPGTYQNTYKVMLNHLNRSPYKQSLPEENRLPQKLASWAKNQLSIETAHRFLCHINASINWAIERGLVDLEKSPFENVTKQRNIKPSKPEKEIDPFSLTQRNAIIEHYRTHPKYSHYYHFVAFSFYCGCRPSEAIALEKKNLSADLQRLTFSQAVVNGVGGRHRLPGLKTQSKRTVYCSEQIKEILEDAITRTPNQIVFPGIKGGLFGEKPFRKSWAVILSELGIDYRKPYQMRHTFITLALEAGVSVKDIAKMVGNSPEMIYKHYAENVNRAVLPDL